MSSPTFLSLARTALTALCLVVSHAFASSVLQQPIETLIEESPLVFEGKVTAIRTESTGKRVYTWITLDVLDVIKGDYADDQIALRYLGGTAGGVTMRVSDQTMPAHGEQGIYFMESLDTRTVHPLKGWGQGHFILDRDPTRGEYVVRNSEGKVVTGLSREKQPRPNALNAKSAGGVTTAERGAQESQAAMTRETFKAFIQEVSR